MPKSSEENRRLAAVMVLDMVGYSALMARDEKQALSCVKALEEILRAEIASAGGRLVKLLGDGSLAEFPTALSAVACSRKILERIASRNASRPAAERFEARVGLHLGELVDKEGDIFGDAVNIAARVQPLADPGGVAMTDVVYAQVKNQGLLRGVALSPQRLKNIPEKVGIFLLPPKGTSEFLWRARRGVLPAAGMAALVLLVAFGWYGWRRAQPPIETTAQTPAAVSQPSRSVAPSAPAPRASISKPAERRTVKKEPLPDAASPPPPAAGETPTILEVRVEGIRNLGGEIGAAVFNKGVGYPIHVDKAYEAQWLAQKGRTEAVFVFDSLPGGEYAVSVVHDEDGARRVEKTESGFPKEGVGFSNNQTMVLRAPRFSEAKFLLSEGKKEVVLIRLDYSQGVAK